MWNKVKIVVESYGKESGKTWAFRLLFLHSPKGFKQVRNARNGDQKRIK